MSLEASERETVITTDDTMDYCIVYSCQRKIWTKLKKISAKPYKEEKDLDGNIVAKYFKLDLKQLSFRKITKISEDTKKQRKQRMLQNRKIIKKS